MGPKVALKFKKSVTIRFVRLVICNTVNQARASVWHELEDELSDFPSYFKIGASAEFFIKLAFTYVRRMQLPLTIAKGYGRVDRINNTT
jgi:hypothetical protein